MYDFEPYKVEEDIKQAIASSVLSMTIDEISFSYILAFHNKKLNEKDQHEKITKTEAVVYLEQIYRNVRLGSWIPNTIKLNCIGPRRAIMSCNYDQGSTMQFELQNALEWALSKEFKIGRVLKKYFKSHVSAQDKSTLNATNHDHDLSSINTPSAKPEAGVSLSTAKIANSLIKKNYPRDSYPKEGPTTNLTSKIKKLVETDGSVIDDSTVRKFLKQVEEKIQKDKERKDSRQARAQQADRNPELYKTNSD